jgi:hypothetical protein
VAQGVLHDRLQDEGRDERAGDLVVDLPGDAQAIAEPDLLDLEVLAEELELARERRLEVKGRAQQPAEHLAEQRDHLDRAGGVAAADQHRDAVERVEQEVRLELHAERAELGFDELGLQPSLLGLLVTDPLGVFERVAHGDQARVGHEEERRPGDHVIPQLAQQRHGLARTERERMDRGGVGQVEGGGDREAGRDVRRQRAESERPREGKPSAEPDHRRRGQGPDRPARRLHDQGMAEHHQAARALRVEELLRGRDDRDHAPRDGRDQREAAVAHPSTVARIAGRVEARADHWLHHDDRSRRSAARCRRRVTARCESLGTGRVVP